MYVHTYIHTYIIHTYIHTYIHNTGGIGAPGVTGTSDFLD
jgi:hypothetical protein